MWPPRAQSGDVVNDLLTVKQTNHTGFNLDSYILYPTGLNLWAGLQSSISNRVEMSLVFLFLME